MAKIIHDTPNCIGCGACAAICPDFWEMGSDGKSHIKGGKVTKDGEEIIKEEKEIDEIGCNQEAAESCPVKVITIEQ